MADETTREMTARATTQHEQDAQDEQHHTGALAVHFTNGMVIYFPAVSVNPSDSDQNEQEVFGYFTAIGLSPAIHTVDHVVHRLPHAVIHASESMTLIELAIGDAPVSGPIIATRTVH